MSLNPPLDNHPHVLFEILEAKTLTDQDKHDIFWTNARRLFGLPLE